MHNVAEFTRLFALLDELTARPVTYEDFRQFRFVAIPSVVEGAAHQNRPLTLAEASAAKQLITPKSSQSNAVEQFLVPRNHGNECEYSHCGGASSTAANHQHVIPSTATPVPAPEKKRSGIISNIPFSVFLPQDERGMFFSSPI